MRLLFSFLAIFSMGQDDIPFSKEKIELGGKILIVDVADSPEKWERGLMFRKNLGENQGMLFIFPDSKPRTFWMKNTLIPLSIGFFDENRILREKINLNPPKSALQKEIPSYDSRLPARYVLEVNQGWFEKNQVQLGSRFQFIKK